MIATGAERRDLESRTRRQVYGKVHMAPGRVAHGLLSSNTHDPCLPGSSTEVGPSPKGGEKKKRLRVRQSATVPGKRGVGCRQLKNDQK